MSSILVAVDESEAGLWALDAGVSLAQFYGSELHVLHGFKDSQSRSESPNRTLESMELSKLIYDRVQSAGLERNAVVQERETSSCEAIRDYLHKQPIDLLTIGSYPCSGQKTLPAEKLYPELPCSLLALNSTPLDFVQPVDSAYFQPSSPAF
jgi:nucleotide-binding universal stress UspA family protein